jgi:hypothetical protein
MELELIPETKEILKNVEGLTKKRFKFIPNSRITSHAKLKIARGDMENHVVYYKEGADQRINHIIAHECGHIIRIYEATSSERLTPYFSSKNYEHALEESSEDIGNISKIIYESKLNQLIEMLFKGLVMQLTNQPIDLKIEEWIYNDYPGLRESQILSFKSQLHEAIGGLNEKIRSITPSKVYEASHSMNYAYFNVLAEKAGFELGAIYNDFEFENKGRSLIGVIEKYENNFGGDVKRIDDWAKILDLSSWYEWKKFEDVPSNYEYMI